MKPDFVMAVPAISTRHMPSSDAPLQDMLYCAKYEEGYFIYFDEQPFKPWMEPIRNWLNAEFPGSDWVRFDADGEVMPELPVFDW